MPGVCFFATLAFLLDLSWYNEHLRSRGMHSNVGKLVGEALYLLKESKCLSSSSWQIEDKSI